jgi:hypothetical protein
MRDDTSSYDQPPRTDPIPAAPDEAGYAEVRTDPRTDRMDAEPGFTDAPMDQGQTNGEPGFADAATVPGQAGPPAGSMPIEDTVDAGTEDSGAVLFGGAEVERFRGQWRDLQAGFVDNPQEAVQGADHLVDEVLAALTEVFNAHKQQLENQWQGGETEELRVALRRYRSFFDQLLNA